MTHFLVYWRSFWEDGSPLQQNPSWTFRNEHIGNAIVPGDRFWFVAHASPKRTSEWRLVAEFTARAISRIGARKYGHILVDGDRERDFLIAGQSDFEKVLRQLEFASGSRITLRGSRIGQAIQTVRTLSARDGSLLETYAKSLP